MRATSVGQKRRTARRSAIALAIAPLLAIAAGPRLAEAGATTRQSVDGAGIEADGFSHTASIDRGGRLIAFYSVATNLVPGDTNGFPDVFVRDVRRGITSRVAGLGGT